MHRGKNRSRKPVEFSNTSSSPPSPAFSLNNLRDTNCNLSPLCLNSNFSGSRPIHGLPLSSQDHDSARHFLESSGSTFSLAADNDPRGRRRRRRRRRSGYMDDFFSIERCGTLRGFAGSTMEDSSWGYTPLTVNNATSSYTPKQGMNKEKPDRHCFIMGADVATTDETPLMMFGKKLKQADDGEEEERKKRVHRFLDEWPSSNSSSVSTSLFI